MKRKLCDVCDRPEATHFEPDPRFWDGRSTKDDARVAHAAARAMAKRLGPAWMPRAWENLGWHHSAYVNGMVVHGNSARRFTAYGGRWVGIATTPERAARNALKAATKETKSAIAIINNVRRALNAPPIIFAVLLALMVAACGPAEPVGTGTTTAQATTAGDGASAGASTSTTGGSAGAAASTTGGTTQTGTTSTGTTGAGSTTGPACGDLGQPCCGLSGGGSCALGRACVSDGTCQECDGSACGACGEPGNPCCSVGGQGTCRYGAQCTGFGNTCQ